MDVVRVGNGATGAIAGGVAAGAALLFAAPAIALAWWRRRKPQDHFFDVPGLPSLFFSFLKSGLLSLKKWLELFSPFLIYSKNTFFKSVLGIEKFLQLHLIVRSGKYFEGSKRRLEV